MAEHDPPLLYQLYQKEQPRLTSPSLPGDPDGMFEAFYKSPLFHLVLLNQYNAASLGPICRHEYGLQIASTKVGSEMWEMLSNAALRERLPRRCRMVMDRDSVQDFTHEHLARDRNGRPVFNYSIPDSYVFDVTDPLPIVAVGEATALPIDRASESNPNETYYQKKLRWRARHVRADAVHQDAPCIFIVKQDAVVPSVEELGEPREVIDLCTEYAQLEEYVACPGRPQLPEPLQEVAPKAVFARLPLRGEQFRSKLVGTEEVQHLLETVASLGRSSRARITNALQMHSYYLERLEEATAKCQPTMAATTRPAWLT